MGRKKFDKGAEDPQQKGSTGGSSTHQQQQPRPDTSQSEASYSGHDGSSRGRGRGGGRGRGQGSSRGRGQHHAGPQSVPPQDQVSPRHQQRTPQGVPQYQQTGPHQFPPLHHQQAQNRQQFQQTGPHQFPPLHHQQAQRPPQYQQSGPRQFPPIYQQQTQQTRPQQFPSHQQQTQKPLQYQQAGPPQFQQPFAQRYPVQQDVAPQQYASSEQSLPSRPDFPIQQQTLPEQQQTSKPRLHEPVAAMDAPPLVQPSDPESSQTDGKGKKRRGKPKADKGPVTETSADKPPTETSIEPKQSSAFDIIVPQRKKLSSGGTKGRKILIETNHLALQFKNLGVAIHYDVAIDPDKPKKLLRVVMEQFRKMHYPNRFPAFDGTKNLYSSSYLPFGEEISGEVTIQEDDRDKTFKIKIKSAAHVDLTVLSKYFESAAKGNVHMVTPQEAVQCIDVVLRSAPSLHCIPVGRSFFTKPRDTMLDLGEGMEMYYGFYQSAILGWKPFLNVDVSHKAFPKSMPILDAIQEVCRNFDLRTELKYDNFDTVEKFLRNLKITYLIPNQPSSRRIMRINGLDKPPNQARFKNENNVEMSVSEYFERVKNVRLKYPNLPCLWVGSKQREPRILLPLEFCSIVEGQVVNRTMTAGQTSSMIRIAATSTKDRKHKIMNSVKSANFSKDKCAGEFQISVNEEFHKIEARVLNPPELKYAERNPVIPKRGVWRAQKFESSQKLLNWCVVNLDERTRPQVLQEFAGILIKEGRILGMEIEMPEIVNIFRLPNGKQKVKLEEEFGKLKTKSLILVVLPDSPKEMYNFVKQAAELTVGVVTQCVKSKNVFQRKPSTVGNILLKINAKLNGRNHRLMTTPNCLKRPCMIMGADVTHPSPETRGSVPSVAAVTASHDQFAFQYNITWRLQPSTQEIITDLANIVREHLLFFFTKNRMKPERIIFFRDGVSEGQFEIVVQNEVQAVRKACTMLEPSGTYKPKVTFLVVQKRHHTRFFPTNPNDSEDRNFNVPAGTIVDTEITHPTALDFYLVSHASIQGVARPTKYRKLWDDDDMQEDELEELTYHLCHLFTRCTRSVSYPAPTYYAHLAAARAKVYCERRPINMKNLEREQAQLHIKDEVSKGFPMFFV